MGGSRRLAYLGFSGRGNMGDELLAQVFTEHLAPQRLVVYPRDRSEVPSYLRAVLAGGRPQLLLGGGTFIGSAYWRQLLVQARRWTRPGPALLLGAGVMGAEPGQADRDRSLAELRAWRPLLEQFEEVTVRGPRSAALLEAVGVAARVVGDPGLLVERPLERTPEPKTLGVNLGFGGALRGGDQPRVVRELIDALRILHRRAEGWRFHLIGANAQDLPSLELAEELARAADLEVEVALCPRPADCAGAIARCSLFIGQRLHTVVVASALAIPSVMLSYSLKGDDFMDSIGRGAWSVATDAATGPEMAELLVELDASRASQVLELTTTVGELQGRLRGAFEQLRQRQAAALR